MVELLRKSAEHEREVHAKKGCAGEELGGDEKSRPVVEEVRVDFELVARTLWSEEGVADSVQGLHEPLGEVVAVRDNQNLQVGDVVPGKQVLFKFNLIWYYIIISTI